MGFILRWMITAVAVAAAVWIVPGVEAHATTEAWVAVTVFALLLALLNLSVKPVLQILSLPITVLTLGLFSLAVNALILCVASWLAEHLFGTGIVIESFGSALVASIVISIVSAILGFITGSND